MSRINADEFAGLMTLIPKLRTKQLETLARVVEKEMATRPVSKTEKPEGGA